MVPRAGDDGDGLFGGRKVRYPEARPPANPPTRNDRRAYPAPRGYDSYQPSANARHRFRRERNGSSPDYRRGRQDDRRNSSRGRASSPYSARRASLPLRTDSSAHKRAPRTASPFSERLPSKDTTQSWLHPNLSWKEKDQTRSSASVTTSAPTGFEDPKRRGVEIVDEAELHPRRPEPHIFISATDLPANPSMSKHLDAFLRGFNFEILLWDPDGHYITFSDTSAGREELVRFASVVRGPLCCCAFSIIITWGPNPWSSRKAKLVPYPARRCDTCVRKGKIPLVKLISGQASTADRVDETIPYAQSTERKGPEDMVGLSTNGMRGAGAGLCDQTEQARAARAAEQSHEIDEQNRRKLKRNAASMTGDDDSNEDFAKNLKRARTEMPVAMLKDSVVESPGPSDLVESQSALASAHAELEADTAATTLRDVQPLPAPKRRSTQRGPEANGDLELELSSEAQLLVERSFAAAPDCPDSAAKTNKLKFTRVKVSKVPRKTLDNVDGNGPSSLAQTSQQDTVFADQDIDRAVEAGAETLRPGNNDRAATGNAEPTKPCAVAAATLPSRNDILSMPSPADSVIQPPVVKSSAPATARKSRITSMKCSRCGKDRVPFNPTLVKPVCARCRNETADEVLPSAAPTAHDRNEQHPQPLRNDNPADQGQRKSQRAKAVDDEDLGNSLRRPKNTYIRLIGMALCAAEEHTATPRWVSRWVADNIPGYRLDEGSWVSNLEATMCLNAAGRNGKIILSSAEGRPSGSGQNRVRRMYALLPGLEDELEQWDEALQQPRSPVNTRTRNFSNDATTAPEDGVPRAERMNRQRSRTVKASTPEVNMDPSDVETDVTQQRRPKSPMKVTAAVNQEPVDDSPEDDVPVRRQRRRTPAAHTSSAPMSPGKNAISPARPSAWDALQQPGFVPPTAARQPSASRSPAKRVTSPMSPSTSTASQQHEWTSAADRQGPEPPFLDEEEELALLQMLDEEIKHRKSSSLSLFADRPQYDPQTEIAQRDKIAAIARRRRRKDMFGKPPGHSVLGFTPIFPQQWPPRPTSAAGGESSEASSSSSVLGGGGKRNVVAAEKPKSRLLAPRPDGMQIEVFDTLEDFLNVPEGLVPAIMDKQLVYRHRAGMSRTVYRTGI
ncbi:hypothetical protein BST61_g4127 [Cercospora zeina]